MGTCVNAMVPTKECNHTSFHLLRGWPLVQLVSWKAHTKELHFDLLKSGLYKSITVPSILIPVRLPCCPHICMCPLLKSQKALAYVATFSHSSLWQKTLQDAYLISLESNMTSNAAMQVKIAIIVTSIVVFCVCVYIYASLKKEWCMSIRLLYCIQSESAMPCPNLQCPVQFPLPVQCNIKYNSNRESERDRIFSHKSCQSFMFAPPYCEHLPLRKNWHGWKESMPSPTILCFNRCLTFSKGLSSS